MVAAQGRQWELPLLFTYLCDAMQRRVLSCKLPSKGHCLPFIQFTKESPPGCRASIGDVVVDDVMVGELV